VTVDAFDRRYDDVTLSVLDGLLWDVILGREFMEVHKSVNIHFGGIERPLHLGVLKPLKASVPVRLFEHISPATTPIAVKSQRYAQADKEFIASEIRRLLQEDAIEKCTSPWRAQVVVARNETTGKKCLCVDYSQTVNKFTHLNAYPLPRINDTIRQVSQYKSFSTLDLRSAYHQVELLPGERKYTAFEANGQLYQYKRMPFGLKNAPAAFHRTIDALIAENNCTGTFAYLDDITVCGHTKEEHDQNLRSILDLATKHNLTFNDSKCVFASDTNLLGYRITNGKLQPDPERIKPLMELPIPGNAKALQRIIGMFAYYAQWIPRYSETIKPLLAVKRFPL